MSLPASLPRCMHRRVLMLLALVVVASACADRRIEPARQAIAEVEAALAAAGDAPIKYLPGEVREVQSGLDALKQKFAGEDYAGVMGDAPAVLAAARALPGKAAAREADLLQSLQGEWAALEPVLPGRLEALRGHLAAMKAGSSLPDGLSRDDVSKAARQVEDAQVLWDRALAERAAQRLPEAVTLANQASELLDRAAATTGPGTSAAPVK